MHGEAVRKARSLLWEDGMYQSALGPGRMVSQGKDHGGEQNLSRLLCATWDGRRLAARMRVLGGCLITTGAPVIVLGRSSDPAVWRVLAVLALIWVVLVPPMIGLLHRAWRNRRLVEKLHGLARDEAGLSS
jgi:hypothetical protein